MTISEKALTILFVTVSSIALIGGTANAQESMSGTPEELATQCGYVDVGENSGVSDETITQLQSLGFYGIPSDTHERLYSPTCTQAEIAAFLQADTPGADTTDNPSPEPLAAPKTSEVAPQVAVSSLPEKQIKDLQAKGWFFQPNDQRTLYAPSSAPSGARGLYSPVCWEKEDGFQPTDGCLGV